MIAACTALNAGPGLRAYSCRSNDVRSRLISHINSLQLGFVFSEVYMKNHES